MRTRKKTSGGFLPYYLGAFAIALILFSGGLTFIRNASHDDLLKADVRAAADNWSKQVIASTEDLTGFLDGAPPTEKTKAFFSKAQAADRLFRYKLFNVEGKLRLISDDPDWDNRQAGSLGVQDAIAARVVHSNEPFIEIKQGDGAERPKVFSEAYVPLVLNGVRIGTAETYVDHTALSERLYHEVYRFSLMAGALAALAFLIPMAVVFWQITDRRKADERIRFLATHDVLTGLLNRNTLARHVANACGARQKFALHLIDLDHFKDLNETHGHATGDALLIAVAGQLQLLAGEEAEIGRLGNDQFAMTQPLDGGQQTPEELGRQIVSALHQTYALGAEKVAATCSVGTARSGQDGWDAATLLHAAETAMFFAKTSGRDQAFVFESHMEQTQRERLRLEAFLRNAAENDAFYLDYQPLFDRNGEVLLGFEALLRLKDADGKPISPAVFIPVVEEMGLINTIGALALRQACREAEQWPSHLTVAVNVSPLQFKDGRLSDVVQAVLQETGFAPGRLELEVTEGILLEGNEAVIKQLGAIRALGVSLAVDDFGSGYSSLSYLWRFPFDRLKIDRSLVRELDHGTEKPLQVINTILALSEVLGLKVTIEGIETAHQHALLRSLPFDHTQGYLFGRPMPPADIPMLILRNRKAPGGLLTAPPNSDAA